MTSLSVLTPTLNYGVFISDALASVARQGLDDLQHVVQDGGSSDDTANVLAKTTVDWESRPDGSQSEGLNRALARARGDWIGWLNADEFYLPQGLQTLLVAAGDADVVFGDAVFVDELGRFLRLLPQHRFSSRVLRVYGPFISSCAMIIRRETLAEERWDPQLRRVMDWDLYLRLARSRARFKYVPFPIAAFRVHDAQVTAGPKANFRSDYELLTARHHVPFGRASRAVGRCLHGALKIRSGAYGRQIRARRFRGRDLRWFAGEQGLNGVDDMLATCYSSVSS